MFKQSFQYIAPVPTDVKSVDSLQSFKNNLKSCLMHNRQLGYMWGGFMVFWDLGFEGSKYLGFEG